MADDDEERRKLSPDSSTQHFHHAKHKHRKKKKHKHKSKKQKRKHSEVDDENSNDEVERKSVSSSKDSNAASGCEQEPINADDFILNIKPMTEFIEDRKSLNEELFKIFGRKEIKKLLPKSIKKMPMDELKSRCLDQLEVMSKKRLLIIMEGGEMSSSSSDSAEQEVSQSNTAVDHTTTCVAHSETTTTMETKEESVNILEELSLVPDQNEIDELIEGSGENTTEQVKEDSREAQLPDTQSQLLEQEYRARALKSMGKAQQSFHNTYKSPEQCQEMM